MSVWLRPPCLTAKTFWGLDGRMDGGPRMREQRFPGSGRSRWGNEWCIDAVANAAKNSRYGQVAGVAVEEYERAGKRSRKRLNLDSKVTTEFSFVNSFVSRGSFW